MEYLLDVQVPTVEFLKDVAYSDARIAMPQEVVASCSAFAVFHPTTEMELLFWCQVRETTPVGISRTDDEIDGPVLEQLRSEPAPARPDGEATC